MTVTIAETYGDRRTGTTFKHTIERNAPYDDLRHTIEPHDQSRLVVSGHDDCVLLEIAMPGGLPPSGAFLTVEEARAVANSLHIIAACVESSPLTKSG